MRLQIIQELAKHNDEKLNLSYHLLGFEKFKELVTEVYTEYVHHSDVLMFSSYSYWKNLTYSDWLKIFNQLIEHVETKERGVFGFETFMKFFYQVLEIDFFSVYANSPSINHELKRSILVSFIKNVGLLCLDMDYYSENMEKYDLANDDFYLIKQRLLKEGAYEAEVIDSKKYIEDKDGLKSFRIQSPSIPKNWTWVKNFI